MEKPPMTQDEINLLMVERANALRQLNDAVSFMRLFCNSVVKDHKEAMLRLRGHALAWMDKEGFQRPLRHNLNEWEREEQEYNRIVDSIERYDTMEMDDFSGHDCDEYERLMQRQDELRKKGHA